MKKYHNRSYLSHKLGADIAREDCFWSCASRLFFITEMSIYDFVYIRVQVTT